ncbi:porin [Caenimonas terrae]|uniref:Porin n=1 Tax=Caenimonas terrae TaxID=696074 RepID=A0ABW0NM39_9BURK
MTLSLRPLLLALTAASLAGAAQAQTAPDIKFSGFGTLAATHSSEHNADFVGTIFQPNGAGATSDWAFGVDSKLGAQVDAKFGDRWSAVLQVVSQHTYDNNYRPNVEWANVKFQATPELSLRAGRIAAPSFLVSDTRFVGYAQPWVRPPVEVYGVIPITSNDGVDLSYRKQFGSFTNTLQAYYGTATARLESGKVKSKAGWGINDSVQSGDLTLRAGYTANKLDMQLANVDTLLGAIGQFSALPAPIGPQAGALVQKYRLTDMKTSSFTLAASYDPGQWFAMAELVDFRGAGILTDSRSWYLTGGYRFASFTPYATYARSRSSVANEPGIPLPPAAPLNAGLNALLNNQFNGSQTTVSAGVRWDFMKNTALKLQYDHVRNGAGSAGQLAHPLPALVRGSSYNLLSVALDFVF